MILLKLKLHSWRDNVIDSRIKELLGWFKDCWLAGGAAKSIYSREEVVDYDLFFRSPEAREDLALELQEMNFRKIFECPKGELLTYKNGQVKVQLITKRYYSDLEDVLTSFDLTPSMFGYDGEYLYTYKNCIKDVKKKRLGLNKVTYPVATINRVAKYMKKGYSYTEEFGQELILEINTKQFDPEQLALYVD